MPELHYPARLADDVVRLRPWRDGDIACVEQAAGDPRIPEATTVPAPYTPTEGLAFIRRQHERLVQGQGVSLAIADHDSDEARGLVILQPRPQAGVAGLGYWMVPAAWAGPPGDRPHDRMGARHGRLAREGLLRSFLVLGSRRADVLVYSRLRD